MTGGSRVRCSGLRVLKGKRVPLVLKATPSNWSSPPSLELEFEESNYSSSNRTGTLDMGKDEGNT